ncbi:hypothetical protein F4778DRAFT_782266 [Xylariomycetidae sp. FL2044]|nr:hypothetical protein F4778DRAFT_782266 [Xylariomycetidae sp. FL2044]
MDHFASILLSFPTDSLDPNDNQLYDGLAKAHCQKLDRLPKEGPSALVRNGAQLLDFIDPSVNSLSYLAILHSQLVPGISNYTSRERLLEKLVIFLLTFDPRQIRYGGTLFHEIITGVENGTILPPSVAVEVLATALLRLDPTGSMLTSHHFHLARLAYTTDNIPSALTVMDKNIVFYPGMTSQNETVRLCDMSLPPTAYIGRWTGLTGPLKPPAIVEYDLLRGMMYCSLRDWEKACSAFERAITFPTRDGGASKIMVEAYKKWVLVSLLAQGKQSDLPSYTGAMVNKLYGTLGKPYTNVASHFATENVEALRMEAENNNTIFAEDCNTGLMQEVLAAYQKWRVLRLQDIYSKISITEIRKQTKSAETGAVLGKDEDVEMLIQNMIIAGMLKGVIEKNDDGTAFLTFLPPSIQHSEQDFAKDLAETAVRLKQLQPIFKATRERLATHKEYIKHLAKDSKRTDNKTGPNEPNFMFDPQIDEEDLMADH